MGRAAAAWGQLAVLGAGVSTLAQVQPPRPCSLVPPLVSQTVPILAALGVATTVFGGSTLRGLAAQQGSKPAKKQD